MLRLLERFERAVVWALVAMMVVTVTLSTLNLAWTVIQRILEPPFLLMDIAKMFEMCGLFLVVLIGVELIETIKTYITGHEFRLEVVFVVAMIAAARKIIILEVDATPASTLLGAAALILSLAIAYRLIKSAPNRSESVECTESEKS